MCVPPHQCGRPTLSGCGIGQLPADPSDDPSDAFDLAALVAAAAEVLRGDPVRIERGIDQLATDAQRLVDAGVAEAAEIAALLDDARRRPSSGER